MMMKMADMRNSSARVAQNTISGRNEYSSESLIMKMVQQMKEPEKAHPKTKKDRLNAIIATFRDMPCYNPK